MRASEIENDQPDSGRAGTTNMSVLVLLPDLMVRLDGWTELEQRLNLIADPVALSPHLLEPEMVARLYENNQPRRTGRRTDAWLSTQMFQLDMSISVVLRSKLDDVDLTEVIAQCKGSSAFLLRSPGDLRAGARFTDKCLSLMHSPDDSSGAEHDLRLLVPGSSLVLPAWSDRPALAWHRLRGLRSFTGLDNEHNPYGIIFRSVVRAATLLSFDTYLCPDPNAARLADHTTQACAAVAEEPEPRTAYRLARKLLEELAILLPGLTDPKLFSSSRSRFEAIHNTNIQRRRHALRDTLEILLTPDTYDARTARFVIDTFVQNSLYLTDWERHRLTTAFTFFDIGAQDRLE